MPRSEAAPKADLTFIVGDPRSRQNLSRIRAHASRATKKAHDDFDHATPVNSPYADSRRHEVEQSVSESANTHPPIESADPHHRPWTPESHISRERPCEKSQALPSENVERQLSDTTTPAASSSDSSATPNNLPSYPTAFRFSTQGSTIGTWWERYPEAQTFASGFNAFDPHKRSRLAWEQDQPDAPGHSRTPEQGVEQDDHIRDADRTQPSSRLTPPSGSASPQPPSADESDHPRRKRPTLKISTQKKTAQKRMQNRWRVGQGPSKSLLLPLEHPHTQFEMVLRECSDFYQNAYETVWEPLLRQNSATFEAQSDYEMFYESLLSAAGLIEAGQLNRAAHVIQCIMEMMINLLHQSHPEAYYFFLNLSLQTNSTALAQLRSKMREYLYPLSQRILGSDHPITKVLNLQIPEPARDALQTSVLRRVRDFHLQTFGTDTYQSLSATFIFARTMLDSGQTQYAQTLMSSALAAAERAQGMNSLVTVYLIIEKAAIYMSATPPDTSIVPELHLSDAFRRLQVIEQQVAKLPEDSMDAQKLEVAIVHSKIVGLRMLGRLHCLRKNFGAAIQVFSQVVEYGLTTLGPDAVPVLLAQADLEATKLEELRNSMEEISMASSSVDGKGTAKPSEEELHVAQTALGIVKSANRRYLGERKEEIPGYKGMVVGYTVVGMPTFCHTTVI